MDLTTAQEECARLVRTGDPDRFFAALFAAQPARDRLVALYAFNVELARIPETVGEPMIGEIRLAWWREALPAILSGAPPGHPVAIALAEALAGQAAFAGALERSIDARRAELHGEPMENLAELSSHLDDTAGTLASLAGRLAAGTGTWNETADRVARQAGLAWGLAGMLRMLPYHAAKGRVLLPRDLLAAEGVEIAELLAGRAPAALRAVILRLRDEAAATLAAARSAADALPKAALPALLYAPLALDYMRIIVRPGFDPFRDAAALPLYRRQLRLLAHAIKGRI